MNCAKIQRCLLCCERPEQPPVEVRRHLAECPGCRALQRRLVNVEQLLPLLPVPPAPGRDVFLARVRAGEVGLPATGGLHPPLASHPGHTKERGLRKLALAFALAAALSAFALCWWAWPTDPYVLRQKQRDQLLSQVHTPPERVQILANLADRLQQEARGLVEGPDAERLRLVARFYREVVRVDLLKNARQTASDARLSDKERRQILETVAEQLNGVESEVQRLLAAGVPDASKAPLQDMALASRESHDLLRDLVRAV